MDIKTLEINFPPVGRHWEVIAFCIGANNWNHGAEIGLARGATFDFLLRSHTGLHMIGVDPFRHMPDAPGEASYREMDHIGNMERVVAIMEKHKPRARVILATSAEAAPDVADDSLDFVFIDGDHSYEAVREDIFIWSPKVKNGGWIMGHDLPMEGVSRAVVEAFGEHASQFPHRVWAAEKRD